MPVIGSASSGTVSRTSSAAATTPATLPNGLLLALSQFEVSPEGKALKFVHRGSYDNMDNTYEAITNHLDDKKLENDRQDDPRFKMTPDELKAKIVKILKVRGISENVVEGSAAASSPRATRSSWCHVHSVP